MSFVRWVFYDPDTGYVRYSGMQHGDFAHISTDEAAITFGVEGAECMQWDEPDPDIESAFSNTDSDGNPRIVDISVDVSKEPHELVFHYSTPTEFNPTPDESVDMMEALALLGVVPEEDE